MHSATRTYMFRTPQVALCRQIHHARRLLAALRGSSLSQVVTGGTVSQTGVLNSGKGVPSSVAIPTGPFNDGAIYIGYYNNGKISKIQKPATAPTAPTVVGGTFNSIGVLGLAFIGNNLFLAELGPPANAGGQLIKGGQITELIAASPDVSRGNAIVVNKPISRLQSPDPQRLNQPQVFINPAAIAVGPVGRS